MALYYAPVVWIGPGRFADFFPTPRSRKENVLICVER